MFLDNRNVGKARIHHLLINHLWGFFFFLVRECAANVCSSLTCVCPYVYSSLCRAEKRQASAALSYSDTAQAASTTSDGCSSFNCMSVLNDGIVNSYTFCPIAFQRDEGLERLPRLAVAIWREEAEPSLLHHHGRW